MPITQQWAYFDHAAVAPISGPAQQAMSRVLLESAEQGDTRWSQWYERLQQTRRRAASLVSADESEIALVPNTTAGISIVAEGRDWQEGDNVVTLADEFPSNLYPWMNLASRGVETRRVETEHGRVDWNRLEDACDERTRIVSLSWVGYANGFRRHLRTAAEIAHRRGALLFVDAIQALGVFPLDVRQVPVDFFAADGHKWLLGPEGAGLLYIRREHLERLRPLGVGWHSVVHDQDFSHIEMRLKPAAARFEGGTHNMAGFIGLGASLELLESCGSAAIGARLVELNGRICEMLDRAQAKVISPREEEFCSGIVMFEPAAEEPHALRRRLLERNIAIAHRGGRLRISPHAYNNDAELERLAEAIHAS